MTTRIASGLFILLIALLAVAGCAQQGQQPGTPPVGDKGGSPAGTQPSTGSVVFTITDAAADMGAVRGIMLSVDSIRVHSASEGWVTVSSTPKTYDLLQLKASGTHALLADAQLKAGTYDQLRLDISGVSVKDASGTHDAKLPSGELKVVGNLVVGANSTSTAAFDFIADKSLHVTGKGEYILAPVVQLETRQDADVEVRSDSDVSVRGGNVRANTQVGMDIAGNVGVGLMIRGNETLEIEAGKVKIGVVRPVSAAGRGRLVVGITDNAVKRGSVSSVMVTVDNVSVHSSAGGWVTVSSTPKTYDMVKLNATGAAELFADANIEPGAYEQVRLHVSSVMVADANGTKEAKLPSGEMKLAGRVVVAEDLTSTALLDFILDESLHITGNGEYIMAPVIKLETRENAIVEIRNGNRLVITGGAIITSTKIGMDASGKVGVGIKIRPQQNVSIVAGKVKVTEPVSAGGGGGY